MAKWGPFEFTGQPTPSGLAGSAAEKARIVEAIAAAARVPELPKLTYRGTAPVAGRAYAPGTLTPQHEPEEPGGKEVDVSENNEADWSLINEILSCEQVRTAYLWGPPGLGKTYAAYHYGRLDRGLYAVTLTEETPAAELRGHWIPRGGTMEWLHGPVILAMLKGSRLVLNEITHASPDAWSFLLPILEGFGTARLTLPTGETVSPADGFHVICTDNAEPAHLPAALKDRFDATLHINAPHPSALALLPETWRPLAIQMASLAENNRVSIRSWLSLLKLEPLLGMERAIQAVFGRQRAKQIVEALALKDGQARDLREAPGEPFARFAGATFSAKTLVGE